MCISWMSWICDIKSYFQDGSHVVISYIKVLPSGECTHSICPLLSASNSVYSSWSIVHSYLFKNLNTFHGRYSSVTLLDVLCLLFICRMNFTERLSCWKLCYQTVILIWSACKELSLLWMKWYIHCHRQWRMQFLFFSRQGHITVVTVLFDLKWF